MSKKMIFFVLVCGVLFSVMIVLALQLPSEDKYYFEVDQKVFSTNYDNQVVYVVETSLWLIKNGDLTLLWADLDFTNKDSIEWLKGEQKKSAESQAVEFKKLIENGVRFESSEKLEGL